jgi:hypothetical protein
VKLFLAIGVYLSAALPALAQNPAPGRLASAPQNSAWSASPNIHPAVALIVAPGNGSTCFGSGTLVYANEQYGLVVTNWHVINEATGQISVHFPDGFYSLGTVLRVDRDWDLAAVVIRKPNALPVRLAPAAPRPGETLTIAGYGSGNYRAASGPCTQYVAPGTTFPFEMVEVAVSARQGDSGGPIFNSRGELAGVLFGEGQGRTSGSYCGRVRWFLSNLVPTTPESTSTIAAGGLKPVPGRPAAGQTQAGSPPVMLAQTPVIQASHNSDPVRTNFPPTGVPRVALAARPERAHVVVASAGSARRSSAQALYLRWEDVAGDTIGEQVKTILAIIGVLPVVLHVMRWLGRERARK